MLFRIVALIIRIDLLSWAMMKSYLITSERWAKGKVTKLTVKKLRSMLEMRSN